MTIAAVLPHRHFESGAARAGEQSEAVAVLILRGGLGLIFLWFGATKFMGLGASSIIANNPLLSWMHATLGVGGAVHLLGVFELVTAGLLLAGFVKPMLSAIGGAMAAVTFFVTLTCLFTTPGVAEPLAGGFPALSAIPGQFLLKDAGLFGISIFIAGESLMRARSDAALMTTSAGIRTVVGGDVGARIRGIGITVMRYALALIFLWFGAMKFTNYEATGIAPFIANSPIVGWWHSLLGIAGSSYMLGVFELATAVLLVLCPFKPRACVVGSGMAVLTFLVTLSFLFSTPGVFEPSGFPALSAVGEFLLKDIGLLGISVFLLGEALIASAGRVHASEPARA